MCCILWKEILVPVYRSLPLQPVDLKQLFIVYCKAKPYIHFMDRECNYYSQMIIHHLSCLHSGLLIKEADMHFGSSILLCVERTFRVKECSIHTTQLCGS